MKLKHKKMNTGYGFELLLDVHSCDPKMFNRASIDRYFTELCEVIEMERCEVHFWDDVGVPVEEQQTEPHAVGTSAVCFILTSTIVIHTLDLLEKVFVNIFSCKTFDPDVASKFTAEWFKGEVKNSTFVERE